MRRDLWPWAPGGASPTMGLMAVAVITEGAAALPGVLRESEVEVAGAGRRARGPSGGSPAPPARPGGLPGFGACPARAQALAVAAPGWRVPTPKLIPPDGGP
jgi:hypothetical protein